MKTVKDNARSSAVQIDHISFNVRSEFGDKDLRELLYRLILGKIQHPSFPAKQQVPVDAAPLPRYN